MKTHRPHLVAIDSNTLVWGIRTIGTPEQLTRARYLFSHLEADRAQVIVPSIVVCEYLTPINPVQHKSVIAELTERFIIAPFDVRCASLAATLFKEGKELREMDHPNARKCLRADAGIIATASIHGAKQFFSGDKDCRNLAARVGRMVAYDLPDIPANLFEYEQNA